MVEQPQTETFKRREEDRVPLGPALCALFNANGERVVALELSAAEIHHITDAQLKAVHGASTAVYVSATGDISGIVPANSQNLRGSHHAIYYFESEWGPPPTRRDRSKRPVFDIDTVISREPVVVAHIACALSSALGVSASGIAELVYTYSHHTLAYGDRARFQATHAKLADGPTYDAASPAEQLAIRTAADAAARTLADKHQALVRENRQEDMRILVRRLDRLATPASPRHRDAYDSYSDVEDQEKKKSESVVAVAGAKRKAESPPSPQEIRPSSPKRPRGSDSSAGAPIAAASELMSLQSKRAALEKTERDLLAKRSRQIQEHLKLLAAEAAAMESQIASMEAWLSL